MRIFLLIGIIAFSISSKGYSQNKNDSSYYIKKVKGEVLLNKFIGIADTTYALIKGQVFDSDRKKIQSEIIITGLRSNKQMTIDTDEDGKFNFHVPAEMYSVTFKHSGYGKFLIDTLSLSTGQIQEINISLGSRYVVQDWIIIKADTLTIKQKKPKRN